MPPRSTAQKARIVKASAVPEIASQIADGLNGVEGALRSLAGVFAYLAASASDQDLTGGEIRQLAACMYRTAELRFGGVKYDGVPITQMTIEECDRMLCSLLQIDPKKLPKR